MDSLWLKRMIWANDDEPTLNMEFIWKRILTCCMKIKEIFVSNKDKYVGDIGNNENNLKNMVFIKLFS